jgi:hypothetical protein
MPYRITYDDYDYDIVVITCMTLTEVEDFITIKGADAWDAGLLYYVEDFKLEEICV